MSSFRSLIVASAVLAAPALALAGTTPSIGKGVNRVNPLNTGTGAHVNLPIMGSDAVYSPAPFTQTVTGPTTSANSLLLTGIPAGTYGQFSVTVNWGGSVGNAWSNEAIWALADAPLATALTFYADPGPSPVAASTPSPRTLTWTGLFDTAYTAPANGDLYFLSAQSFGGSSAVWSNVTITLSEAPPVVPPVSTPAMVGGSLTGSLATGEIDWYKFSFAGGALTLDTEGSLLAPSNDTELFLYNATGGLVASDDDMGSGFLSLISLPNAAAGDYYLAVGGFNSVGVGGFGVTSTSPNSGSYVVNGLTVVIPEPTTLAAIAGMGLVALRRRRA